MDIGWVETLKRYLTAQITADEIEKYIKENIDFGKLPNKKAAIGIVIKHFGASVVDGKLVTEIVNNME